MWMGGPPALGYRPDGRSLAIVEEHAAIVRDIFTRHLALGSVPHVTDQLADEGIRSPRRERKTGRAYGGGAFSRGQIYAMLRNPIYAGDIPHKDKVYPGNHPAIIDRKTWDAVQRLRASHVKGERPVRASAPSLLAGLLFDSASEPLLAAHATKAGAAGTMRYRYYVSRSLHHGTADSQSAGVRLPAREIEQVVVPDAPSGWFRMAGR